MTDTMTPFEDERRLIRESGDKGFASRALRIVDDLERLVEAAPGEEERVVSAYYQATVNAPAYEVPATRHNVKKARVILSVRDLLSGSPPKNKYVYDKAARRSPAFADVLSEYESWMRTSGNSKRTVQTRLQRANVLFEYLEPRGTATVDGLSAIQLAEFIEWLDNRYTNIGRSNILYTLRSLFRCPSVADRLTFDPMGLLSGLHTNKHSAIPSAYSADEVRTLLDSIDRTTDSGRTTYLIVVLAAVCGLRSSDIRGMKLGDVDFRGNAIRIVQQKTGKPLKLPLTEEVKLALLDYMKSTRRDCPYENVLIKVRGKAEPYSDACHFSSKVREAMLAAGIDLAGRKAGLHALRHSLATGLLSSGIPVNEIASILGHRSIQATKAYIWSDVERLRVAALEVG